MHDLDELVNCKIKDTVCFQYYDLAYIIPYILVKAKIERLLCHYNYIMTFHYSVNEGDMISVV